MSAPLSLEVVIERIDGMRETQEATNELIREHIADDRRSFADVHQALQRVEQTVLSETARREGHAVAIAQLEMSRVTNDRFEPVRLIVYGMVAVLLVAVLGAIAALVLRAP